MIQQDNGISSKWLIEGMEGYFFGSDLNLYKMPFESKGRHYGLRMIREQNKDRFKINGKWWSKRQLKSRIYLNPTPKIMIKNESDCPF